MLANEVVLGGLPPVSRCQEPRPTHSISLSAEHRLNSFFISLEMGRAGSRYGKLRMLFNGLVSVGRLAPGVSGTESKYTELVTELRLVMESRRCAKYGVVGLPGRAIDPLKGVGVIFKFPVTAIGEDPGVKIEALVPGVATEGDCGGLGECSGEMMTVTFRKSAGEAMLLPNDSNFANGASRVNLRFYENR